MLYNSPLLQPLFSLAQQQSNFVVLYHNNTTLTAQQLLQRSLDIAYNLQVKGFKENDIAVVAAQPGEEFLEIMYAIVVLRGKIAIIDPEMGQENYKAKMQQLQPQWMFIDSRLLLLQEHPVAKWLITKIKKTFPQISLLKGVKLVAVGRKMPLFHKHILFAHLYTSSAITTSELVPDDGNGENIIVYTSGTLSVPKGVLHTANSLHTSITALSRLFIQNNGAIVGTYLPQFMLLGIAAGLSVKAMQKEASAPESIQWIQKENIGILFGPPSDYLPMIIHCEANNMVLPSSLQHILLGSAPVHVLFLQRLIAVLPQHTQITCTYGMTENLLVATIDGRQKAMYTGSGDILGKPVQDVQIKIAEDGEIMVRSGQMYSRYFHEAEGKEWHATGDLGEMDEEANIILRGRKKEMIIRRNMNIYPALYENTIKHIKGIEEAAMVGIYDESLHDEKVYLAIEGKNVDVKQVQSALQSGKHSIDKEALPDHIFEMTIPRKGRQNKIDRQAIADYVKKHLL